MRRPSSKTIISWGKITWRHSGFIQGSRCDGPQTNQFEQSDAGHGPVPPIGGFADAERVGDLLMFESHINLIIELVQGMGVAIGRIPQKLGQVVHRTAG